MGETSIEWADWTFNPWIGCVEVSSGCAQCYAKTLAARMGWPVDWTKDGRRHRTKTWGNPERWNATRRDAQTWTEATPLPRVFCASLADVFEERGDLDPWRAELFELMARTEFLHWLVLTKRADLVEKSVPAAWRYRWPSNVRLGVTVEGEAGRWRLPILRDLRAAS